MRNINRASVAATLMGVAFLAAPVLSQAATGSTIVSGATGGSTYKLSITLPSKSALSFSAYVTSGTASSSFGAIDTFTLTGGSYSSSHLSTVGNTKSLYVTGLAAGTYTLTLGSSSFSSLAYTLKTSLGAGTYSYSVIPSVPEPESIALMLAGLGVVGTVASRRRRA